ncbi:hypothetical protein OS493_012517 [Desmophyllum pertusum]|uniref:Spondin domain-containing protein n=1 Tax=Desmophyllum pertusum TaxID=174260 RepID=A0A9W9ZDM0_9CNID|nr:hypothetical protein OS493_012517 [Desmophyllum pertusum]
MPHYSEIVGATHNASYVMWRAGEKASPGVESVAETGQTTTLENEISVKINVEGLAWKLIDPSGNIGPEEVKRDIQVQVTANFSMVSLITMLAPSPDWFIGIDSLDLCDNGRWRESWNVTASPPWDSGTEDGLAFTTNNAATNPPVNIFQITSDMDGAFKNVGTPIKSLGHWLFKGIGLPVVPQASPSPSTGMTATSGPLTTTSIPASAKPKDGSARKASISLLVFATAALIPALLF